MGIFLGADEAEVSDERAESNANETSNTSFRDQNQLPNQTQPSAIRLMREIKHTQPQYPSQTDV